MNTPDTGGHVMPMPATTPEPVLDQARIASVVTGVLTAVLALAAVLGHVSSDESSAITTTVLALVGAVATAVNTLVPIARGRIAREQVTPWSPGLEDTAQL